MKNGSSGLEGAECIRMYLQRHKTVSTVGLRTRTFPHRSDGVVNLGTFTEEREGGLECRFGRVSA